MTQLKDKVAAVTGAASGIGRMLAVNLAAQGCHLAISDVNQEGLQETAGMIRRNGLKVTTHVVDVGNREQVYRYADETVKQHNQVDIIINNAGVAVADFLEDVSYEDFEWLMNINLWGVVYGTKAFLPYLRRRPEGHVVNISSINSMVPFPANGPYNVSKYAVAGFTETLMQELYGSPVHVSCVLPGGIKTNIVKHTRFRKFANPAADQEGMARIFDKVAKTSADRAARIIISGIRKNRRRILVGADAHLMDLAKRFVPIPTVLIAGQIVKSMK